MATGNSDIPFVIGHRGAKGLAPENTLVSLRRARAEGATWVEFDVMLSRDGVPVLIHDDRVERTSDGMGAVADLYLSDLRKLDAGSWFGNAFAGELIPTFAEAIVTLVSEGLGANVEIKPYPGKAIETADAICRQIANDWPEGLPRAVISSFDSDAIAIARDAVPDIERAMLFGKLPDNWRQIVCELDCRAVHLSDHHVNADIAAMIIEEGYTLRVYTVNDPKRAEELRQMGVASIFTDRPDLIKD